MTATEPDGSALAGPGVFLDELHTNSLVAAAYTTSLATAYSGGQSAYEKDFVGRYADPIRIDTALQALILYGRAYLDPSFDNFVIKEEASQWLEPATPDDAYRFQSTVRLTERPESIRSLGLGFPALSLLRSQGKEVTSDAIVEVVDNVAHYEELFSRRFRLEEDLMGLELLQGLAPERTAEFERSRSEPAREQEELAREIGLAEDVISALNEVARLTHFSRKYGAPALWTCPVAYADGAEPVASPTELCTVGVYLRELRQAAVHSLPDALRIIEEPAIDEFRAEIHEMSRRIEAGEADEADIRTRIRRANRALELGHVAGRVGQILTIVGVPALAIPLLGAPLAVAGIGVLGGEWAVRRGKRWALISNAS